jgi:hypothetical protein
LLVLLLEVHGLEVLARVLKLLAAFGALDFIVNAISNNAWSRADLKADGASTLPALNAPVCGHA